MERENTYTAFENHSLLFHGPLADVVLKVKQRLGKSDHSSVLIFSDSTGKILDFNFQGSEKEVAKRLEVYTQDPQPHEQSGPGRPKLGVMSREISLLPRHWEWLATQPGGASATLRKLVEDAKKKTEGTLSIKQIQERTYKFMSVLAGDLPGYEEALRALYKRDKRGFLEHSTPWPKDIRKHSLALSKSIFTDD